MAPALTEDLEVVMQGSAPKMIPVGSTAVRELLERYTGRISGCLLRLRGPEARHQFLRG